MFVPPAGSALNVVVKPSAAELVPGAKGVMTVTTTDASGAPVPAEVVLSVFDSAILAIAPDNLADVRYWDATSRIKRFATNPGRNLTVVYKVLF